MAAEALHLTLVFLGYRPEKEIEPIAAAAFGAVAGLPPPELAPAELRAVPPRRPRLFALDLEDREGRAAAVQSAASRALASARFYRPERRPFWPHVTVARVKRGRRAAGLPAEPPSAERFTADEVTLYRSILRPQGAVYEPLERLRLG